MKKITALLTLVCLLPVSSPAASTDPLKEFPDRVHKITLSNGMRILFVERPTSPSISFDMFIRTGGLDDEGGKTGLAHMFEHMLFKGTKTIGTRDYKKETKLLDKMDAAASALQQEMDKRGPANAPKIKELGDKLEQFEHEHQALVVEEEYWKIFERAGAKNMNAGTGYDYTTYSVTLPSNFLELWAVMEADRIQNPVLREFYKERSVVMEERRQRYENSPHGKLWESFLATAFMAHPYGRPIVGWESDISRVTRQDADHFFKSHYDVSRLVIGIVGGVKKEELERIIRKYFEPIKSHRIPTSQRISVEPVQSGERRVHVEFDAEPSLLMGFHRPDMMHPDEAALSALASIFSAGRTSRLYRNIVEKKRIAVSVWAGSNTPGERDPSLFAFAGSPRDPFKAADLEKAIFEEIETMKKNGPTERELQKVKNNLEADLISGLSSNEGLAGQLAYYEALADDWNFLFKFLESIRKLTPADVQRVANLYLTESNRTVGVLVRKKS